jgi:hypothetical protein
MHWPEMARSSNQCRRSRDHLISPIALTRDARGAEMETFDHHVIGSRDLMEQLAPRQHAKAPRSAFVGS